MEGTWLITFEASFPATWASLIDLYYSPEPPSMKAPMMTMNMMAITAPPV